MPQSLSKVIIHLIFSTKDRHEWIDAQIQPKLHAYLATTARDEGWECYRVGGVKDHVHLALRQPRTSDLSHFVGHIKRTSTVWIKKQDAKYDAFHWQTGYGAFSVSASHLDALITYISKQEEHHRKQTFQDEFRAFLGKYGIEFDERYVWD
ncbi:transposase [Oceaniferula spumae]|uniref:Transposase n=1 Tax=Oceaniferula spumae TaxID=2979115 RepID=A0AAT9FRT9_9BACT